MDITTNGQTLSLHGDFDVRCTSQVRNALYQRLAETDHGLVVDMTGVGTIDVTALRLLAVATRHAGLDGRQLTLRNPGPQVRRMLHVARLAHALDVEKRLPVPA